MEDLDDRGTLVERCRRLLASLVRVAGVRVNIATAAHDLRGLGLRFKVVD